MFIGRERMMLGIITHRQHALSDVSGGAVARLLSTMPGHINLLSMLSFETMSKLKTHLADGMLWLQ
jgi:hypothetical protein